MNEHHMPENKTRYQHNELFASIFDEGFSSSFLSSVIGMPVRACAECFTADW